MKVQDVSIASILPYSRNPRRNAGAVAKVAASIREFGWRQPIVVDRDMTIVCGHTRLLAARQLGLTEVPVHIATELTPQQVKAYRIADNRLGEQAEWDDELLSLELEDLKELGVDLELTGFDDDELERLMGAVGGDLTDPDEVPPTPKTPVSRPGDLWLLGPHRLLCGDATSAPDVQRLFGDQRPHLMVTDPPYGVGYDPTWRRTARSTGLVKNDDRADWRAAWALFPGDVAYVWHGGLHADEVAESLRAVGFELRAQIVWRKQHFVFGRGDYHWQHEPCWYAVRKGKTGHWAGDRNQTTIWDVANRSAFGGQNEDADTIHGTQKPVEVMRRPIENNSTIGQLIYEPFAGSGTTLIAAEQTARVCFAIEIDPVYVDVAIERWQSFTGKSANLSDIGMSFSKVRDTRLRADGMER